jgi:hypothetical protein
MVYFKKSQILVFQGLFFLTNSDILPMCISDLMQ